MRDITYKAYQDKILRVHMAIRKALAEGGESPSLEDLAGEASMSPYHFHRVFKGMTGESVAEHIRRLRLERAAGQLKFTDRGITDIAFEAGYEAHESFTRAFARFFGLAPSSYRSNQAHPGKKGAMTMKVTVKNLPARKVLSVRHTGPYAECGKAWETLCKWAGPRWLIGPGTQFLGLSYDDPDVTPQDKIRYDACITVKKEVKIDPPIAIQEIPPGDYACFVHEGPYEKLHGSYSNLCGAWLPHSGRELKNSPSVEHYLNDPKKTPPNKLRIEIQLPLS